MNETATVIIATFGDKVRWDKLAERAIASAHQQGRYLHQLIRSHGSNIQVARNGAVHKATGTWLCFLDADDELEPGYLEAMLAGTGDLRYPRVRYVPYGGDADSAPSRILVKGNTLLDQNHMVIGTLVRREQFLRVGGFPDYPAYEDWGLWLRCWVDGAVLGLVRDAVYRAHMRPNSRNHLSGKRAQELYHQIRGEFTPIAKEKRLI